MNPVGHILVAWKRLFFILLIFLAAGFSSGILLVSRFHLKAYRLYQISTVGLRHIGAPLLSNGTELGIDAAVVLVLVNTTLAFGIVSLLYLSPLLDPHRMSRFPARLRKFIINDPTVRMFYPLPSFRAIPDKRLRPAFVWLYATPFALMIFLGLVNGSLAASAWFVLGSPLLIAAYLVPHGMFEIPAVILAAALPLAAYLAAQPAMEKGDTNEAFAQIRSFKGAKTTRYALLAIFLLLVVAGLIEAHLTERIAAAVKALP